MSGGDQRPETEANPAPSLPFPGVGQTWLLLLAFLGCQIVAGIVFSVVMVVMALTSGKPLDGLAGGPGYVWMMCGLTLVTVWLLLLIGKARTGRPWAEVVPLSAFDLRLIAVLPIVAVGLSVLVSEVDNALRVVLPTPGWLMEMMLEMVGSGLASFVLLVVVAPLTEEALFRGLVWQGYVRRYGPRNAIIYSALMFAVWHLNPYQMLGAFVIGLVLGWLRHRTGSLWPCILLHALANSAVFVAATLVPADIPGFTMIDEPSFQPWWLDLSGLVLAGLGLFLLWRLLEKKRPIAGDGMMGPRGGMP